MSNKILLKRSGVANAIPSLANVSLGELAINTNDGKLYTKIDNGVDEQIFELTKNQLITLSGDATGNGTSTIPVLLNATQSNITAVGSLTSLTVVGNIDGSNLILTGDVNSNNISVTSNIVAAGNITGEFLIANTAVIANVQFDNLTTGNITATGFANITGNVTGGNIITVGNINATGNIAGDYFIGNGRFLSGIDTTLISNGTTEVRTYENGNVAVTINGTANVVVVTIDGITVSGNANSGNVNTTTVFATTVDVTGNVDSGNVNTGFVSVSGDIETTGNITTGSGSGGNITGANVISANTFIASANVSADGATITGNITNGNTITSGLTSTATLSVSGNANVGNLGTAGSIAATGNINGGNLTTAGTTTTSILVADGNANVGNLGTAGSIAATGNITGGNLVTAGLVDAGTITSSTTIAATGNITGGNLVTTGLVDAGTLSISGNANVGNLGTAGSIAATGNVTGGNLITGGTVDVTGNINGSNLNAVANVTGGNVIATANINGGNVNTNKLSTLGGDIEITTGAADGNVRLTPTGSGNVVLNSTYINRVNNPVQAQDAATKQYVDDAVSTGITIHDPVQLLACGNCLGGAYAQGGTTATVTDTVAGNTVVFSSAIDPQVNDQLWFSNAFNGILANTAYFVVSAPNTSAAVLSRTYSGEPVSDITSGSSLTESVRINSGQGATLTNNGANAALVIDGVVTQVGFRVLLETQANAVHNGVYDVTTVGDGSTAWVLTRSSDMNTYIPDNINGLDAGDYFFVEQGDTFAGESHVMTAPIGPTIIGFDDLVFTQFSASQVYSANTSAGLSLTGTVFSAKVDNDTTAFDGSGNIIVKASANLVTPNIGAATGTSLTVTANVSAGNINTAGQVIATGNITGGNVITTGATSTATLTASGNANVGNLGTAGQVSATGNITGGNLIAVGNLIGLQFQSTNTTLLAPTIGNTAGERVRLFDFANVAKTNYAIGVETSAIWMGVDTNLEGQGFKWYGSDVQVARLSGVGNLTIAGNFVANANITGANLITTGVTSSGTLTVTANAAVGNLSTAGLIVATGNITGGNLITVGTATVTGNAIVGGILTDNYYYANGAPVDFQQPAGSNTQIQYNLDGDFGASANFTFDSDTNLLTLTGNIDTTNVNANYVNVTGNVDSGNVNTAVVEATGNVTGGNLVTLGLVNTNTLSASGNANVGNLGTSGLIVASGNITGGNVITAGTGEIATVVVSTLANITATTAATSNATGALQVAGGVGIVGNVYAGDIYSNDELVLTVESTVDGGSY